MNITPVLNSIFDDIIKLPKFVEWFIIVLAGMIVVTIFYSFAGVFTQKPIVRRIITFILSAIAIYLCYKYG